MIFDSRDGLTLRLLRFNKPAATDSSLFLSSWDINKAFGSLSKNTLRFSWIRLGVPTHIADILASLVEKGHIIVRTPYSHKLCGIKKGILVYLVTGKEILLCYLGGMDNSMLAVQSTGMRPLISFGFHSSVKEGRFHPYDSSAISPPALDIAYADDLLYCMSSLKGKQEKAKIISTFSIVCGLVIATFC